MLRGGSAVSLLAGALMTIARKLLLCAGLLVAAATTLCLVAREAQSARLQASVLSELVRGGGRLISSRAVDRTASFVFLLGKRHFGTVMIHAHEPDAAQYRFTSALAAQLLKSLSPALLPLLEPGACTAASTAVPLTQDFVRIGLDGEPRTAHAWRVLPSHPQ